MKVPSYSWPLGQWSDVQKGEGAEVGYLRRREYVMR